MSGSAVGRFDLLLHPYPTFLVTCAGESGPPNVLAIAWLVPVSVKPPLVAMSVRPSRYSYPLLVQTREFVINVPSSELAREALRCGRRSGRDEDKFSTTGLTPAPARCVRAPIIRECLAHLECRVVGDIEQGDHRLVIGKVVDAYARADFLDESGLRDVQATRPLLHMGGDRFVRLAGETLEPGLT